MKKPEHMARMRHKSFAVPFLTPLAVCEPSDGAHWPTLTTLTGALGRQAQSCGAAVTELLFRISHGTCSGRAHWTSGVPVIRTSCMKAPGDSGYGLGLGPDNQPLGRCSGEILMLNFASGSPAAHTACNLLSQELPHQCSQVPPF